MKERCGHRDWIKTRKMAWRLCIVTGDEICRTGCDSRIYRTTLKCNLTNMPLCHRHVKMVCNCLFCLAEWYFKNARLLDQSVKSPMHISPVLCNFSMNESFIFVQNRSKVLWKYVYIVVNNYIFLTTTNQYNDSIDNCFLNSKEIYGTQSYLKQDS